MGLQFVLGVVILRWTPGFQFFNDLGKLVKVFLDFADEGSKFVFGEKTYTMHPMAFKVIANKTLPDLHIELSPPMTTVWPYIMESDVITNANRMYRDLFVGFPI